MGKQYTADALLDRVRPLMDEHGVTLTSRSCKNHEKLRFRRRDGTHFLLVVSATQGDWRAIKNAIRDFKRMLHNDNTQGT